MIRVETLYINPDYAKQLEKHNLDMVGFVVEKATSKVVDTAVINRNALASWYENRRAKFIESRFTFVLASVSILGELSGVQGVNSPEKGDDGDDVDDFRRRESRYNGKKIDHVH